MAQDLRDRTGSARRRRSSRRRAIPSPITALDPAARDLEGYLFPETYPLPRAHRRGAARPADGGPVRARVRRRSCGRPPKRSGLTVRQAVTLASIVEKEAARAGRAAARRRRLRESPAHRHGAAVRSDGHLRARSARASTPATCAATISTFDSPVQHLSLSGPAARPDCVAGPRVARGGGASRAGRLSVLRQPQRRLARVRADARGAQPQRAEVSGAVLQGSEAGRAERRQGQERASALPTSASGASTSK